MDKTILVCGGAGFMGSDFVRYVLDKKEVKKIIVFDKLTYAGNLDNLKDVKDSLKFIFVKGDISNKKHVSDVFKKYKPEYVVNFAAETHVDRSIHDGVDSFISTNIVGVNVILDEVRKNNFVKKFLQISTDEVYGDTGIDSKIKFKENSVLHPSNPYAVTKASGDLMCLAYNRTYGIPVLITRSGNNYGEYQYPEKLIPFFISRILSNKKMPIYGKGENIRNWVNVRDHSRAVWEVLEKGKIGDIYNISSDDFISNIEISRTLAKLMNKTEDSIEFVNDRPGHDMRYAPDSSKLRKELKWKPEKRIKIELKNLVNWYMENKNWSDKIISKKSKVNSHIK